MPILAFAFRTEAAARESLPDAADTTSRSAHVPSEGFLASLVGQVQSHTLVDGSWLRQGNTEVFSVVIRRGVGAGFVGVNMEIRMIV